MYLKAFYDLYILLELYILKSTMYLQLQNVSLILKSQGKKSFLLSSKDLPLTMKIDYVVRIVMKHVSKRKNTELGSSEGWILAPAFPWTHHKAPGKSFRLPGTQFPFL